MEEMRSCEDLYQHMSHFISWLAYEKSTSHTLMDPDELSSELTEELVKGWMYYQGKLKGAALLAAIRKMLDNRVSELLYKYHLTHRKVESSAMVDYEDLGIGDDTCTPEQYAEAQADLDLFLGSLTIEERNVVDAILDGDDRVEHQMILSSIRRSWVFDNPMVRLTPDILADAFHWDRHRVRVLWESITRKWRRIYDSDG